MRAGLTVAEVCDWYLLEARSKRLLGRNRRPIKESTLASDEGRINLHIKPLIGARAIRLLSLADVERMQADIARGKTIKPRKGGRGGAIKGGAGVGGRSVATLRAVLGHAKRWRLVADNPALGARQLRSEKRVRRLSEAEVQALGVAARLLRSQGENPAAVAALELMLLTGFRRAEALNLKFAWADRDSIHFPDTKSGPQTRAIGKAAHRLILAQRIDARQVYVFPSDRTDGAIVALVGTLTRLCAIAQLQDVTPHTLRHTFASIAGDLGFSELTIAGLLGHAAMGVTQRYVHLDRALVVAAEDVSEHISQLMTAPAPRRKQTA